MRSFHIRYYRDVLAMVYAIEEINNTPDLLPNITLGFRIFDSCMSEVKAIHGVLTLLSGTRDPTPGYSCQREPFVAGVVGELMSSLSLPMARILGIYKFPQISYGAMIATLSDKRQFPSFLRTIPSNAFQNVALPRLIGLFGWTWVGMIISDDDVGEQGRRDLEAGIKEQGGCVVFTQKIHLLYPRDKLLLVAEVIRASTVNVIVVQSTEVHVAVLMEVLLEQNVTGKVFIFSVIFIITPGLFSSAAWRMLNGTIGIAASTGNMPGFKDFLRRLDPSRAPSDNMARLFWEKAFQCRMRNETELPPAQGPQAVCSGREVLSEGHMSLFELYDLTSTYHTYAAVYTFASALNKLLSCQPGEGPFVNGSCTSAEAVQPWQVIPDARAREIEKSSVPLMNKWKVFQTIPSLPSHRRWDLVLHYVKGAQVKLKTGENIVFDENGDVDAAYDIINVQIFQDDSTELVKVGKFDPWAPRGQEVTINKSAILWSSGYSQVLRSVCNDGCRPGYRKASKEGEPACCFDCVACSSGEFSNETDASACFKCPDTHWPNEKRDACNPKEIEFLSYGDPLGLTLTAFATFFTLLTTSVVCVFIKHRNTPIVKANNRDLSFVLLLALMLCFLCPLVFIGRPGRLTCLLRQTLFGAVFSISISSVLAKTVIVVSAFKSTAPGTKRWLGNRTPAWIVLSCTLVQVLICALWLLTSPPYPELNLTSGQANIILECNEGEGLFFYCMMGYMGLLAMVSFVVAFVSRNLPGRYNEAKLITFSLLVFVSVWISFIPAYLSTRGKYMLAVEVFAILCSSAGLLCCIFLPKCYVILIRPEQNTRKHLVPKGRLNEMAH
ncbi:extracellular calcium-sensing receptor-like [Lissotriton helveticus]